MPTCAREQTHHQWLANFHIFARQMGARLRLYDGHGMGENEWRAELYWNRELALDDGSPNRYGYSVTATGWLPAMLKLLEVASLDSRWKAECERIALVDARGGTGAGELTECPKHVSG